MSTILAKTTAIMGFALICTNTVFGKPILNMSTLTVNPNGTMSVQWHCEMNNKSNNIAYATIWANGGKCYPDGVTPVRGKVDKTCYRRCYPDKGCGQWTSWPYTITGLEPGRTYALCGSDHSVKGFDVLTTFTIPYQ